MHCLFINGCSSCCFTSKCRQGAAGVCSITVLGRQFLIAIDKVYLDKT